MDKSPAKWNQEDWEMLHYAVGMLLGLASKYGQTDVTFYYNSVRFRIEQIREEKTNG